MKKLVLLRHGESTWNRDNRFTGWTDVPLSGHGEEEAASAADLLAEGGYRFDIAYTSVLKRAVKTLWIVLEQMDLMWLPTICDYRLNERHYGALQGLDKADTAREHGKEQVHRWRRGYRERPPALTRDDSRWPGNDRQYAGLDAETLPLTESLADTVDRFLPCWRRLIAPDIEAGRHVLIVAHGNSLRALVKYLDDLSGEEVADLNIPTGIPLVYELDDQLRSARHFYLGDRARVERATKNVADQLDKS